MTIAPTLITPPVGELVPLADLKRDLLVGHSDDDGTLTALANAAIAYLDGWSGVLGRCLVNQTWQQKLADWPASRFVRLPFGMVSEVVIKYDPETGSEATLDAAQYGFGNDHRGGFVRFNDNFTAPSLKDDVIAPVKIELTAGYGDVDAVPQSIKTAITMLVGHWYENREGAAQVPPAVEALIRPHRQTGL